jgi:hypothetical protein
MQGPILLRGFRGAGEIARLGVQKFNSPVCALSGGGIKGAFVKAHDGRRAGACFDGDDVEAAVGGIDAAGETEALRDAGDVALLFVIDGVFGAEMPGTAVVGGTRFHFDECERGPVVTDDVDLAFYAGCHEITSDHHVAFGTEKPVSVGFAADSSAARVLFRDLRLCVCCGVCGSLRFGEFGRRRERLAFCVGINVGTRRADGDVRGLGCWIECRFGRKFSEAVAGTEANEREDQAREHCEFVVTTRRGATRIT